MIITCATEVEATPEEVENSRLFRHWVSTFDPDLHIENVHVVNALSWKGDVRMIFANVVAIDPTGARRTPAIFLRGSTVEILPIIVAPDGTEYVVFVEQFRVPAGQWCVSTPAGMVDFGNVEITALQEMAEEVGGNIKWSQPQWLNQFATGNDLPMLVSPGGTDEEVSFCVVRTTMTYEQLQMLHGTKAGAQDEDENTSVHVVILLKEALPLLSQGGRRACMKTVLSLLLYNLSRQFRAPN